MKRSTYHQIVGCLVAHGHEKLAAILANKNAHCPSCQSGHQSILNAHTSKCKKCGTKWNPFTGKVKSSVLASKTADTHGRLMQLEDQLKVATKPERRKMLQDAIKRLKERVAKKQKTYESGK